MIFPHMPKDHLLPTLKPQSWSPRAECDDKAALAFHFAILQQHPQTKYMKWLGIIIPGMNIKFFSFETTIQIIIGIIGHMRIISSLYPHLS